MLTCKQRRDRTHRPSETSESWYSSISGQVKKCKGVDPIVSSEKVKEALCMALPMSCKGSLLTQPP